VSTQADRTPGAIDRGGADPRGGLLQDVSNALVRLHKRYVGRGPTKARTTMSADLVVCVLEGGFTQTELTLRDAGLLESVDRVRRELHEAAKDEMVAAIEGILGRRVRSFLSSNDAANDIQIEAFVLEPADGAP
jgi:uncharacterized protein YbcI